MAGRGAPGPAPAVQGFGQEAQGTDQNSIWNLPATAPDHIWSYDFLGARTRSGVAFRILNIVDEFTRQCMGCRVDHSIGTLRVIEELEACFER